MTRGIFRFRPAHRYFHHLRRGLPWLTGGDAYLLIDLIAHWKLDEAAGNTRADSRGTYDLTDNNTVAASAAKINDGAAFTATSSHSLSRAAHEAALSAAGGFTFAGWVAPTGGGGTQTIAAMFSSTGAGSWILRLQSGTTPRIFVSDGSTLNDKQWGSALATDGTLYFVDCGYDPATDVIWINVNRGTRLTFDVTGYTPQEGSDAFKMGVQGGGSFLNALNDEWAFWGAVKTDAELDRVYNGGSAEAFATWGDAPSSVTVAPSAATAVAKSVDPTVVLGSVIVTPDAATCIAKSVDPTVVANETIAPSISTAVAASVDPIVVLGSVIVTPDAATCIAKSVDPTIVADETIAPSASTAVAKTVDPTVVANETITPSASSAIARTVDPTVDEGGGVTVSPDAATAVAKSIDPTVVLGSVTVTTTAASAVAASVDPTIVANETIAPSASTAIAKTVDPTVVANETIALSASSAVARSIDPTVILGSVTVTTTASSAVARTIDPSVDTGVLVTPSAATCIAKSIDPTVVYGSVTVTATAASAIAVTLDPTVVRGSVAVTPTAVNAVAKTVGPSYFQTDFLTHLTQTLIGGGLG